MKSLLVDALREANDGEAESLPAPGFEVSANDAVARPALDDGAHDALSVDPTIPRIACYSPLLCLLAALLAAGLWSLLERTDAQRSELALGVVAPSRETAPTDADGDRRLDERFPYLVPETAVPEERP